MEEAEDNRAAGRKWQRDESSVVSALLTLKEFTKNMMKQLLNVLTVLPILLPNMLYDILLYDILI